MTSEVGQGRRERVFLGMFRLLALILTLVGAAGSIGLMLYVGRHNDSRLLLLLFAVWVLTPFVALMGACVVSKGWRVLTGATLYTVMVVVTLTSLCIYGYIAFGPPRQKSAFAFVAIPPVSLLLAATAVLIAATLSSKTARRDGS